MIDQIKAKTNLFIKNTLKATFQFEQFSHISAVSNEIPTIDAHLDQFVHEKDDVESCELNCYLYILLVTGIRPDTSTNGDPNNSYTGLNSLSTDEVKVFKESNKLWLKLDFIEKRNQPYKKKFQVRKNMFDAISYLRDLKCATKSKILFDFASNAQNFTAFLKRLIGIEASPRVFRKLRFSSYLEQICQSYSHGDTKYPQLQFYHLQA